MIIRDFTLDGFGIFADQGVQGLPDGLSVFLGDNEAGKSTCLRFFRQMLFGFPTQAKADYCPPLRGGAPGGVLQLTTAAHGVLRLERRPGPRGGVVTLTGADGTVRDASLLETLLGGTTREVYESVYGFSLTELQELSSLSGDKVRHALYGASFGTSTRPVGQVLKQLESTMEGIFKDRGQNPQLNRKLNELDEVLRQLRACESGIDAYERLTAERQAHEAELEQLLAGRRERHMALTAMERRLALWEQMRQRQILRSRLAAISPVIDNFPVEGLARLERLRDQWAARTEERTALQARRTRLEAARAALSMTEHQRVLDRQGAIAGLAEDKGRYRSLIDQLKEHGDRRAVLAGRVQRLQEELGEGWTPERIRSFDRSVFTQERIEQFAASMREAAAEADKAGEQHAQRAAELAVAEAALRAAEADVARLVREAGGTVEPALAERLSGGREYVQRLLEETPRRAQTLASMRAAVEADITQLVPDWNRDRVRALDTSFTARQGIEAMGRTLRDAEQAEHDMVAKSAGLEAQQVALAERQAHGLRALEHLSPEATRVVVEERRLAVRSLRDTLRKLEGARQRAALAQESTPGARSLWLAVCLLPVVAGGGLLGARYGLLSLMGMPTVIPESLVPVAYVLAAAGVTGLLALLAGRRGGIPDGSRAELDALADSAMAQARAAGADQPNDAGLERAEAALDQLRDAVSEREALRRGLDETERELTRIQRQLQEAGRAREEARTGRMAVLQAWTDRLRGLGLPAETAPEVVLSIFDRSEGIRDRLASLDAAEAELARMRADLDEYLALARALPEVAEMSGGSGAADEAGTQALQTLVPAAVLAAVDRALEAQRRARTRAAERAGAEQTCKERQSAYDRCAAALQESVRRMTAADEARAVLAASWKDWLTERCLPETLSPATAQRALQNISECVEQLDAMDHLKERSGAVRREMEAYEARQDALLSALGPALPVVLGDAASGSGGTTDGATNGPEYRFAATDRLVQALAAARTAATRAAAMDDELPGLLEAEQAANAAIDRLAAERRELLEQGGVTPDLAEGEEPVAGEEAFRTRGVAHAERRAVLAELTPLEASLRESLQEAGHAPEGPADPENLDAAARAALEGEVAELQAALQRDADQEDSLRQQIGNANALLRSMASAEDAAELRAQEAAVREDIRRLSREWARHALAHRLVLEAKRTFERERQPEVIRNAGRLFSIMTGETYSGLHASLEDDSLRAVLAGGEARTPEQLSRGTQEQLFLALRLGYILSHSAQSEPLPVVMDDILVNFDPGRAAYAAAALADLAQHNQVLFFTCHPQTADVLRKATEDSAMVFRVEEGTITPS